MKKLLTTLFAISAFVGFAQTPQGINYQSIIRNTGGTVMASTPVTVEFKLYNGLGGVMLYHETHSTTTNSFGMANLTIGQGTPIVGNFSAIPWVVGVAYEVYVNSNLIGTKQLFASVPYALHAGSAPSPNVTYTNNILSIGNNTISIPTATAYVGGTGISVSGSTITNTLPDQTVTINGTGATTVSGTYPNFTINSSSASATTPTIIGVGATTVTSSGNTFTVDAPASTTLVQGSNVFLNQSGSTYTVGAVTPTLSGSATNFSISPGNSLSWPLHSLSIASNSLSINGPGGNTVVLPGAASTSITPGANISVLGSAPNYTVSSPSQSLSIAGNSLSITAGNTITIPAAVVVAGNSNISVTSSANTYSVSAVTPTINTIGNISISGTYPSQTLSVTPQVLSIASNTLSLSNGGGSVTLPAVPTLSLTGTTLSSGPTTNSVNLSSVPGLMSGGILNRVPKWTSANVIGNSNISDNGAITMNPTTSLPGVVINSNALNAHGGNLSLQSSATASNTGNGLGSLYFGATGGMYDEAGIRGERDAASSGGTDLPSALVFYTTPDGGSSNTERMRITNQGNVGIGNNTPNARLDVLGTFKLADGTQGAGKVLMSDGIGNATWQLPPAGPWSRNSGTVTLTTGTDFVGIGTNTPNAPLQVANYISFENNGSNTSLGYNTGGGISPNNYYNTFVGAGAGQQAATGTGNSNSFLGYHAGQNITNGVNNTFMGTNAGVANNVGSSNSFFGTASGQSNSTGINNVFVGAGAGSNNTTAQNNTFLGMNADLSSTTQYTNATAIGFNTKVNDDNTIALGNNSDVVMGGTKAGIVSGASRYLTIANTSSYSPGTNTSLEIQGYTNSANASSGRIDFINGLSATAIARVEAITSSGSTVQGALRFFTNAGTLTEVMRITPTGSVGIGVTNPGGLFELGLDQGRKPGTTVWTVTSDERLKTIEGAYTKGLNEILQLNPVKYHYKNVGERQFKEEVLKKQQIGFSAQEVQRIFPEAVEVDADGYLSLNIHAVLIAYTNAVKELNAKAEAQQKTIEEQKKAMEELQLKYDERLKKLEAALETKTQK